MQRKYEYRRKLPRYQPDFKAFFITFSTYHRWLLPEPVRQIVIDTCLAGNGRKFRLHAVVVMPDHVHMVLTPTYDANGPISVAEIMHSIKDASAHRINKSLGRKGTVWEGESFDRRFAGKKVSRIKSTTYWETRSERDSPKIPLNIRGFGGIPEKQPLEPLRENRRAGSPSSIFKIPVSQGVTTVGGGVLVRLRPATFSVPGGHAGLGKPRFATFAALPNRK